MSNRSKKGLVLAAATATLLMAGSVQFASIAAAAEGVKCAGANNCKGTSECKSATNSCKGQNTCKGKGWVTEADEAACTKASGTVAKE